MKESYRLSELVRGCDLEKTISGEWLPVRPLNEDYRTLWQRLVQAWGVIRGRHSVFVWK